MLTRSAGFTLVELAIALMIIGLLIGGVLKGIELVENARVMQTLRDVKSYETAMVSFQSIYGALPGDIRNPATRLADCSTAPCNIVGNGNGEIGPHNPGGMTSNNENNTAWYHLAAAKLISGLNSPQHIHQGIISVLKTIRYRR